MKFSQNPVVKDALITLGLAVIAALAVAGAGFAVHGGSSLSKLEQQAQQDQIALIRSRTILDHAENTQNGQTTVSYTYLGAALPEKLASDEVVALRKPDSWTRQIGTDATGKTIYTSIIYPNPQFVEYKGAWYRLGYGQASADVFNRARPQLLFSLLGFSIAHATVQNVLSNNGNGYLTGASTSWATARATTTGSGGSIGQDGNNGVIFGVKHHTNTGGKFDLTATGYYITRSFFPFDTGFIPVSASITAASLNLQASSTLGTAWSDSDNDGFDYLTVVQTSQADIYNLVGTDFDNIGSTEGIDTGERKDLTTTASTTYYTFNLNSTGRSWIAKSGQASACGAASGSIFLVSGQTTWTVPYNWDSTNNSIEVVGGGGGGAAASGSGGGGAGGGAYSKATNVVLTPGQTVGVHIAGGAIVGATGDDTYFCNSTSNCTAITDSAVVAGAKGGGGGAVTAGGTGGASASGVGSTKFSGGNGGSGAGGGAGGGGAAAGPNGAGKNGGAPGASGARGGGGGGGADGGSSTAGSNGVTSTGGAGGQGRLGTGSGAAGTSGQNGGGGGGGTGRTSTAGDPGGSSIVFGSGEWSSGSIGVGGGGGGGGQSTVTGGDGGQGGYGGTYGGGGGGGALGAGGGAVGQGGGGAAGLIVINYTNAGTGTTCLGIREGHDFANNTINTDTSNTGTFVPAASSDPNEVPYLAVTYSAANAFWQFQDF